MTRYQEGRCFQAGGPDFATNDLMLSGLCVTAMMYASAGSTSAAKACAKPSRSIQRKPCSSGRICAAPAGGVLGPSQLTQNEVRNGQLGTAVGSTQVAFDAIAAPILYTSWTQVAAVVPYAINGTTAQVTVTYLGQASAPHAVPVMPSSPGVFTLNQTGTGQAAAINAVDGTVNTTANPVKIGDYISLFATGEGQTAPAGVDGKLSGPTPPRPPVSISATGDGTIWNDFG